VGYVLDNGDRLFRLIGGSHSALGHLALLLAAAAASGPSPSSFMGLDFAVELKGDRVDARLQKYDCPVIQDKLDLIGRLLIFTRQMNMLMTSEISVEAVAQNFLQDNYRLDLEGLAGAAAPPRLIPPDTKARSIGSFVGANLRVRPYEVATLGSALKMPQRIRLNATRYERAEKPRQGKSG
jgi:hypothetical protein